MSPAGSHPEASATAKPPWAPFQRALASRLVRSSLWAIAGSGGQNLIVFLLFIYLARVLEPRDFGIMSLVAVGVELGTQVVRWGQVELLQQQRYRNDISRNQAFRLSALIAALLCGAFLLTAGPVGRLYHSEQLTSVICISAPVLLFTAVGATPEAILRSEFRFRLLALRGAAANLIGAAVAVGLVALGFGVLALAVQRLVQAAIGAIWVFTAVSWRPRLLGAGTWSRVQVAEGAGMTAGVVLPLLVPRAVDLAVGVLLGPAQLGLMRIAFRINDFVGQLVVVPLVGIANAELSRVSHELEEMRRSYLRLTQASATLICPVLIGSALIAPEAIPIVFGQKWRACVPLVQIISLLALAAPMNYYFSASMVALGHSRLVMRQGVVQLVLGLSLVAFAARISLEAVVIAHVVRGALVCLLNVMDVRRRMQLRLLDLWRFMSPAYVATFVMASGVTVARWVLPVGASPAVIIAVLVPLGGALYLSTLVLGARVGAWPDHASSIPAIITGPSKMRGRAA